MRPDKIRGVMGKVTAMADSTLDGRLKAMADAKNPPAPEMEPEGMESQENEMELTPDEVAQLKAMLAQQE